MGQVVYVYSGPGATVTCSNLLMSSLQRCLCPRAYRLEFISPELIKQGKWTENCAALVLGGGYDMGFLTSLGKEGCNIIREFVMQGGTYIGFCAGAYFACDQLEFEKGTKLEVCGDRLLKFYPGKCIGSVVPNFTYDSEKGAAALPLTISVEQLSRIIEGSPRFTEDYKMHAYVNGGGFFSLNPSTYISPYVRKVENIAFFDSLEGRPAAVVRCEIGVKGGVAILSSPHIEFAAFELSPTDIYIMKIDRVLRNDDRKREWFLKSFLQAGNLKVRLNSSL